MSEHLNCSLIQFTHSAWVGSLVAWALDSRLRRGSISGRRDKYLDAWPSSGGQITSVFYQATQANSASYPQRDGKWVLCGWEIKAGMVHSACG